MKLRAFAIAVACVCALPANAAELIVRSGDSIQAAINNAQAGDTILVEPGRYVQSVYIDKTDITLKGIQRDGQYAHLDGEGRLNDGIIASGHGVVIDGFKVTGYKGNGIMTQGANNFVISNNYVNSAFYGIFPQFGKNGLVKGNTVTGAEDAAIYVGMSDNIDVVENETYGNVMGIEFENTRTAVMADNNVHDNSAGIVLSLITGLPVKTASDLVVRNNVVRNNNLENFAPESSIAASVPAGVGIIVLGPDNVTLTENVIESHHTLGAMFTDIYSFGLARDAQVDPFPENIQVFNNRWNNNGYDPQGEMGALFAAAGMSDLDMFAVGKEIDSCYLEQDDINTAGLNKWTACDPQAQQLSYYDTARIPGGAEQLEYTMEQKGRLTYLAVCTGCHTYNAVLHGPSVLSIKALYDDDVDALVDYIANPVRKREDFGEMPSQAYLGEETLKAIANYILFDLTE